MDLESGLAFTGHNDLRIPSDSGTAISLKDDIASAPAFALFHYLTAGPAVRF